MNWSRGVYSAPGSYLSITWFSAALPPWLIEYPQCLWGGLRWESCHQIWGQPSIRVWIIAIIGPAISLLIGIAVRWIGSGFHT